MPWSIAVVLIVAMVLLIPLYALRTKAQRGNRRRGAASEREQRLQNEVAELRDRVATLERIVTDGRYHLDKEFEKLHAGADGAR